MAKKEQSTPVIVNRKANHLYFVDETFEVGIMLIGSEVKSIRDGKCTLGEAWIDIDETKNEIWLVGAHIDEYLFANRFNHFPARRRKLLAHVHEIVKMRKAKEQKGCTLIPLKLYFKNRRAKLCTHYPFLLPVIRRIAGPGVQVIDPAPAVARQLLNVLHEHGIAETDPAPGVELLSSGDPTSLHALASCL